MPAPGSTSLPSLSDPSLVPPGVLDAIRELVTVVGRLRGEGGCAWDRAQDRRSLVPYLLEEIWELVEALEGDNPAARSSELGDVLFHLVLQARLGQEEGLFDLGTVARGISAKLVRRHPAVFGSATGVEGSPGETWEARKATERGPGGSLLDGVPGNLPALRRAEMTSRRAARVGFDWPDVDGVQAKVDEERRELAEALASGDRRAVIHEYGDLLLATANLGRFLGVGPEEALQAANRRFEGRFRCLEALAREQEIVLWEATPETLDLLWTQAKRSLAGEEQD